MNEYVCTWSKGSERGLTEVGLYWSVQHTHVSGRALVWQALGSPLVELTNQWLPARSPCTVTLNQQEESETNARSTFFSMQGRREANALGGWGWHWAWIQIFG